MDISCDYKDLFIILNRYRVRYMVVGAYAVVFYTKPRFTKDLDIWVESTKENADRLYKALKHFGAPLKDVTVSDFTNQDLIYQIGVAPVRVDIIMGLAGLEFEKAWKKRKRSKYAGVTINMLGKEELIYSKEKSNREQDRLDLKYLKRTLS